MSRSTRTSVFDLVTGDRIAGLGLMVDTIVPTADVDNRPMFVVRGYVSTFSHTGPDEQPVFDNTYTEIVLPADHEVRTFLGSDNPTLVVDADPAVRVVDDKFDWTRPDLTA